MKFGRIIYYGAGEYGQKLFNFLQQKNKIIAWIDKSYEQYTKLRFVVMHPDELYKIHENEYDSILVAVMDENVFNSIKAELIEKYNNNIHEEKIIWLKPIWNSFVKTNAIERVGRATFEKAFREKINANHTRLLDESNQKLIHVKTLFLGKAHLWNTMRSVSLAFEKDTRCQFEVLIWDKPDSEKYNLIKKDINRVRYFSEVNLKTEKIDILLFNPYLRMGKGIKDRFQNCGYLCEIPVGLVRTRVMIEHHLTHVFNNLEDGIDACIYDRLQYRETINAGVNDPRIVEIGNPKFDNIYDIIQSDIPFPKEWEKIGGKKTVLWTTDHDWSLGNVTFDLYFREMISWFTEHKDMGLIFRPHPLYIKELSEAGIWTTDDIEYIKNCFKESENMIFDDSPDYSLAYKRADSILCDVNCGIIVSALPLGKPLGVMRRYDGYAEEPLYPQLTEKLYQIEDGEKLRTFLYMTKEGKDPRRKEREEAEAMAVSHFDGKNGERIKEYVISEYIKKAEEKV